MNGDIRMRLLQPHTHAGIAYAAGAEIEVAPDTADRLTRKHIAQAVTARNAQPESDAGHPSGHSTSAENEHGN